MVVGLAVLVERPMELTTVIAAVEEAVSGVPISIANGGDIRISASHLVLSTLISMPMTVSIASSPAT